MKTVYRINLGTQLAFAYEVDGNSGVYKYKTYSNIVGEVLKEDVRTFDIVPLKQPTW